MSIIVIRKCDAMSEDLYLQIIQKQKELIDLMLQAGFSEVKQHVKNKNNIKCDLDGFKNYLRTKGRSENTIDTYSRGVELYYRDYKVLNEENLAEYEKKIKSELKPKTVNLRIAGMTAYFKYIGYDFKFHRSKEQKKTFCNNAINEVQYNQLISWAKENSIKVWLIAKVIASTGVRVSELTELKTSSLEHGYCDIIGKGQKQRRIYFPERLVKEIKSYCGKIFIIENRYGKQMTTRGIYALLLKASEKAGIPKEVMHPHSFRHFFAKQFLKEKNDISLLGDLLGHGDISTTAIYTRMTSEEQQEEINKLVNW